ncbi:response regulator [Lentzea sp. NBRC 105346]|uniref:response regulator n=1 Tax=Lentzea sp. NBRC 105346 TaxID=3032205 RepID=UPI002556D377|nr:response regulator [Lentzea sp. NBRC 105346]
MKVLVIEDDQDILGLLECHLRGMGLDVALARSGEQGLELARADLPDVVVVDIVLPGKDGRWVIRELRSDPRTKHCQIVVTSMLDADDIGVGDVDALLLKPFDRAAVRAALKDVS